MCGPRKKALRVVRRSLNQEIEQLENRVRAVNVVALPAFIALLFVFLPRLFGLFRRSAKALPEPEE